MSGDPEVAALKATVKAQAIEIRDLKLALSSSSQAQAQALNNLDEKFDALTLQLQPLLIAGPKLQQLLDAAERRQGMEQLGKVVAGTGFFSLLGAAVLGVYHYFAKGMTP